jgi:hypothetical protein
MRPWTEAVRPIYAGHGFALSFNTAEAPGPEQARIVCDVSHVGGHTRRYHIDMPVDGKGARGGDVMTKTHAMGSGVSYGMRYLLRMIFNLAIDYDDDGNAAGGRAKPERPRTVVPAPKHALKQGGIAERAMVARVAQAWEPKPPKVFRASQAGHVEDPPPHDSIPDGPGEAARALNRRLHPMNDELPGDLALPKQLDQTERDSVPAFLDRRRQANGNAGDTDEASFVDLVTGGGR